MSVPNTLRPRQNGPLFSSHMLKTPDLFIMNPLAYELPNNLKNMILCLLCSSEGTFLHLDSRRWYDVHWNGFSITNTVIVRENQLTRMWSDIILVFICNMPAKCRLPLFVQAVDPIWLIHFYHTGNRPRSLNELTLGNIWMYDRYFVWNVILFMMLNCVIETEHLSILFLIQFIFTRGQYWPTGIVVACVCVCVCLCVCQSVCQSLVCQHNSPGPVQARITKFGP